MRPDCCTECCTVYLSLLCLPLRSRSPHNAQHFTSWGERERAPTLLMSMEIVYIRTCVHVRPLYCACANVVPFLEISWFWSCFGAVCFWSRKCPKHTRKRPSEETAGNRTATSVLEKRQERLRDGYDSTPDPAYSCLRCSAQRQTATWLLYRVLYSLLAGCSVYHFAHARPTMPSISLIIIGASASEPLPC